ncbi:Peroxiredoxin [Pedobacter sp. ok626]|uniref:TlpA disulfide reductase family protein n=1 Tax=Pedobacter sp. ok626 TaxID=1761882 RepID=UPI00088D4FE0|nr:TlpA disulfide reductase family protein [Pedobacter sp. ok626]SDJ51612.1 Peroxiredoxin [Pedobacter sp. ok626]
MKKILILLILIFPILLHAQNASYILKGKIARVDAPAKVYMSTEKRSGTYIDSATVQKGQFELKGTIADPYPVRLVLKYEDSDKQEYLTNFYLEPGIITISSADSFKNAIIKGSKLNADNEKLKNAVKLNEQKLQTYLSEWRSAHPGQKEMDSIDRADYSLKLKENKKASMQIYFDFIKENPNSFISLDAIKYVGGPIPNYAEIAPLFNSLSPDIKNTITGKEHAKFLTTVNATAIGKMAPEFTLYDPDGKPVKLSDFKGKYVLVDFWASWCMPCRAENPNLIKAFNKFHGKGLEILGVSFDDEKRKNDWLAAIKKDGLLWKNVSDLKGWNAENVVAGLYGIRAIPQNVLLDKTGKIIGKNLKGEALNKKLEEIFH